MLTTIIKGNMFNSKAQTLTNTVNCVGVMGKGVALQFKQRYFEMFLDYKKRCARNEVVLGCPYLYKQSSLPWILNFPTKGNWRWDSKLKDIINGLEYLEKNYEKWGITSLAIPPLGCGNGGLDWNIIGPIMHEHFEAYSIPVEIYAPY